MTQRDLDMVAAPVEISEHCRPEVGTREPGRRLQPFEQRQAMRGTAQLSDREGAIEGVEGGRSESSEQLVALDDAIPTCFREGRS